jgi:hypothetical protein
MGALLLCSLSASVAHAEPSPGDSSPIEGVVLKVADGEIILDLGHTQGLPDDTKVRVYRKVEVTHPVTQKTVVDRFPIGELQLTQVGETLSIGTNAQSLDRLPSVGDYVVWTPSGAGSAQKEAAATDSSGRANNSEKADEQDCDCEDVAPDLIGQGLAKQDPALAAVDAAFAKTLGRPLSERIEVWSAFLDEHPSNPYAAQVAQEVKWLRARLDQLREATTKQSEEVGPPSLDGRVSVPTHVSPGAAVELVATFEQPERVQQVRVLMRRYDQPGYTERLLERSGDKNWRVRLDDEATEPGELDFFVEAVREDDTLELLHGSAGEPITLTVEPPANDPARRVDRSKATGVFEYVNFNSGEGKDEYLRFESDYRYHIGYGALEALKVGVGIFDGAGGPIDVIESGGEAEELTIAYGFAEMQFELNELVGISGRLLVGDRQSQSREGLQDTFGLRTELRIGRTDATRLELGAAQTDGIGNEAWIKLAVDELDQFPMSGEVVVTNLPVGEDLGVMLNYGTGYEFTDWFTLMARVGWNARTIQYQGPSVGLGSVINW